MKVRKISGTNCPTFFYQATHQTIAGNVKLHLGWGSSLRTPKPSTGWCQKSRKNVFSNLQNHPTVLRRGGKTFVSAGTGEAKQQVRKTRKNDLRTLELRCLFYKVLCISNMVHIMRNLRGVYTPEKCGLQKCKRTKKKCPKIGESLRIFDIFQHRSKPSGHRCLR